MSRRAGDAFAWCLASEDPFDDYTDNYPAYAWTRRACVSLGSSVSLSKGSEINKRQLWLRVGTTSNRRRHAKVMNATRRSSLFTPERVR